MPTYKLDHAAFGQAVLRNRAMMEAALKPVTEAIRDRAEANASVGPASDPHRGEWKSSFVAEVRDRGDRMVGVVESTDPLGAMKEFDHFDKRSGKHVKGDHALLRALR